MLRKGTKMPEFTEDDVGKIVHRGTRTYEVDPYGKLVPVAKDPAYIARRNRLLKECPW